MKGLSIVAVSAMVVLMSFSTSYGDFVEDFQSYPLNAGVVASGGPFHGWGFGGYDAFIVADPDNAANKVLNITDKFTMNSAPDVVTNYFADILASTGYGKISFDVYQRGIGDNTPQINYGPGPGTAGIDGGDYSAVHLTTYMNGQPGRITDFGNNQIALVTDSAWHHVDMILKKQTADVLTKYFVDGVESPTQSLAPWTPEGVNAIEFGCLEDLVPDVFVLVDNLHAQSITEPGNDIPEPATLALLGLAVTGLGGYIRRRRAVH